MTGVGLTPFAGCSQRPGSDVPPGYSTSRRDRVAPSRASRICHPYAAMTPKRLPLASPRGAALLALLVVGPVQLAGSSTPSRLRASKLDARADAAPRWPARRPRWPRCTRRPAQLLPGGARSARARLAALRGRAAGDQQVGLVVRALPQRVRRLPARVAVARARGRVPRHRLRRHEPRRRRAFLRRFPVSYPSYYDQQRAAGTQITDSTFTPVTVFYDRPGGEYIRQGPYPSAAKLEADVRRYALRCAERAGDPHRPAERAPHDRRRRALAPPRRRAGGHVREPAEPIDPRARPVRRGPRGPHAARAVCGAAWRRARPTRPAGRCGSCRTCTPRSRPRTRRDAAGSGAEPRARPAAASARRSCSRSMPATGAHEVIVNAPQSVLSLAELPVRAGAAAMEVWRERCARTRRAPTCS